MIALVLAAVATTLPVRLSELHTLDVRVATIGDELAIRGRVHCPVLVHRQGLVVQDLALYGSRDRAEAARLFGLKDYPVITAVIRSGDRTISADLRPGDEIMMAAGRPLGPVDAKNPYGRIAAIEDALESGLVTLGVRRGETEQILQYDGSLGCRSRIQLVPGRKLNARADGTYVQLTDALVREAADDDELAFIIAHEMAHNILRHAETPGSKRVEEDEADRLGLKLMKAAGRDLRAAARFWSRFGDKTGFGILSDGSHRRTKARVAFLTDEAAKLTQ